MEEKKKLKEILLSLIRIYQISPLDFLSLAKEVVDGMVSSEVQSKTSAEQSEQNENPQESENEQSVGVSQSTKVVEQPAQVTILSKTNPKKVKTLEQKAEDDCPKYKVGWFAFEGEKYSPNPKAYPNCQGVVSWVNPDKDAPVGKKALILLPETFYSIWGCWKMVDATSLDDGRLNTQKILRYARENKLNFPAAEWCASYCKNGISQGEVFWPAVNQLEAFAKNIKIINQAMEQIGGKELYGICLSSSEHNCFSVMMRDFSNGVSDPEYICVGAEVKDYVKGKIYEVDKHLEYTVRAVIAI